MSPRLSANFAQRAAPRDLPELMDGNCSYEDFNECLRSLEQVNRWLLGYRPTLAWLEKLSLAGPVHIVDVGSGGGGLLRRIARWAAKRQLDVRLTGIDFNPHAKRAAQEATPAKYDIEWITGNAFDYQPDQPIDIIVSSLMTHHLENDEIVTLLRWMQTTARLGWFINDLERSGPSSRMFEALAKMLRWHLFVQHDGPVSFRRAFRIADWEHLLTSAGVARDEVTIERWHPGRLCVGTTAHVVAKRVRHAE